MIQLGIAEVLKKAEEAVTKADKIRTLRENISKQLLDVIIGAYDDRVKWLLPEGPVPYKPGVEAGTEHMLLAQTRTFYLYTKDGGAPAGLTQARREILFVQLCESVSPDDAKVIVAMKDKKLPYPSLTRDLIIETFPRLLFTEQAWERPGGGVQEPITSPPTPIQEPPPVETKRGRGRPKMTEAQKEARATAKSNLAGA